MIFHIATDGVPIYRQIINQVKYMVVSGRLNPGDELPPIRVLAEQLVINPNTVARAYRELEQEGIVVSKHGSGTYISDTGSPLTKREQMKAVTKRIDALLTESGQMNLELEELIRLLKERYQNIKKSQGGEK